MTYNELLQQKEWWSKCNEILSRDYYTCKDCGCMGYHNGYSYAIIDDLDAIDSMFNSWKIDGRGISQFCANLDNYDSEHFDDVELKTLESLNQLCSLLHFRLFDRTSVHFRSQPRGFHYGNFVSDVDCEKVSMNATHLYGLVSHNKFNIENSWLYAFKFDKALANKAYLLINGGNQNIDFVISINYDDKLIVIAVDSKETIFKGLNIHHTYYIEGHKPWEYDNEALVTLCEDCHKKRHETSDAPLYDSNKRLINNLIRCDRCGGSGYLPQYSHVEHGRCFKCGGEGVILCEKI